MNKLFAVVLSLMLVLSTFLTASAEENGLTLYYPSYMQASEGETLMLAEKPERIVCLSNAALQILVRCDIHPIAVTSLSSSITYPDWVQELPQITVSMNSLDIESIIAMEPDLVIVGSYQRKPTGSSWQMQVSLFTIPAKVRLLLTTRQRKKQSRLPAPLAAMRLQRRSQRNLLRLRRAQLRTAKITPPSG